MQASLAALRRPPFPWNGKWRKNTILHVRRYAISHEHDLGGASLTGLIMVYSGLGLKRIGPAFKPIAEGDRIKPALVE